MQKIILLSIKPKIIQEIISGEKKFEFRKKFPNINEHDISKKIVIYCSKPKMKIIGSFIVKSYYNFNFDILMELLNADKKYESKISTYFKDKKSCHSMEITEFKLYEKPLSLNYLRKEFPGFFPGQSYRYLDPKIKERIVHLNGDI